MEINADKKDEERLHHQLESWRASESNCGRDQLSVICVWVLFSGTMTHSCSSEAATKARKGTQEKTRLSRFVLANKPSRNTHWQTEQTPRISITLD